MMNRVVQFQRAAIESVAKSGLQSVLVYPGQRYYLDADEVFLHGLSCGERRSDAGGLFAVFAAIPPTDDCKLGAELIRVAGCVLNKALRLGLFAVEAIVLCSSQPQCGGALVFKKKGVQAEYVLTSK